MTSVRIEIAYLPPECLRGNSREHWGPKSGWTKLMRESGYWHGKEAIQHHGLDEPIDELLALVIDAWTPNAIDYDNLLIGFKPFVDGLGVGTKRDPGAGLISDDRLIRRATIRMHQALQDEERCVLTLEPISEMPDWGAATALSVGQEFRMNGELCVVQRVTDALETRA